MYLLHIRDNQVPETIVEARYKSLVGGLARYLLCRLSRRSCGPEKYKGQRAESQA